MIPVSIIVPMRNSETTILETLRSIQKQRYPIAQIIIIDNNSSDSSVNLVGQFAKKTKISIKLIKQKEDKGVGTSYNLGVSKARSAYVIFMHSDSSLSTPNEIKKLAEPFREDTHVVATFSTIILPKKVWETYNFWQKCLLEGAANKERPGLNGKFDCIKKDVFERIGGFNIKALSSEKYIGGEDADLHHRLKREGKVILSKARVIHLHYLGSGYTFLDWVRQRRLLARAYGRLIRMQSNVNIKDGIIFAIKPIVAVLPFMPHLHLLGIALLLLYVCIYPRNMYTHRSTITDPRIILLPFLHIFLLYYEVFWMVESFIFANKKL